MSDTPTPTEQTTDDSRTEYGLRRVFPDGDVVTYYQGTRGLAEYALNHVLDVDPESAWELVSREVVSKIGPWVVVGRG